MTRYSIDAQVGEPLSAAGAARRDAMLAELLGTMKRTQRLRRARRVVLATAGTVALVVLAARVWLPTASGPANTPHIVQGPERPAPPANQTSVDSAVHSSVLMVKTDPTIMQRYRAAPGEAQVIRLTDRSLLETLASIRRPAGLIYRDNQVMLSAPVTDEELGIRRVDR